MVPTHFDNMTRSLTDASTRRSVLSRIAGAALTAVGVQIPAMAGAKNKKKKPEKKLSLNSFGCVDVGKGCRGNSGNCCSGICEGKKPKKGKQDKSRCVAHNTGACTYGQNACLAPVSCGTDAYCYTTTGNAGFCGDSTVGQCAACKKDADCVALGFGQGAACVVCNNCAAIGNTACLAAGA